MSLSNPNKPVTEQRLQEFYHKIEPYMGGSGGTGGGGHTIEDDAGAELTQRDTLQFGDGFNATDDSENEKTVVEPNLMTAADMDDVIAPLPSVQSRYHKYSTEEQVVGEWIDGKPLYQRTFVTTSVTLNTWIIVEQLSDIDTVVKIHVVNKQNSGAYNEVSNIGTDDAWFYVAGTDALRYFVKSTNKMGIMVTSNLLITIEYTKTTD
jgi:hypothetical protein